VVPRFLSGISGYNAEQSGLVMLVSGVPAFLMVPVLRRLMGMVDARSLVIAGLLCFACSCLLDVSLTAQSVGHDFYASQFLRGFGQVLAMMPLNMLSMSVVSRMDAGDADVDVAVGDMTEPHCLHRGPSSRQTPRAIIDKAADCANGNADMETHIGPESPGKFC
jgi:predicted MFS family arabinose efflux permease